MASETFAEQVSGGTQLPPGVTHADGPLTLRGTETLDGRTLNTVAAVAWKGVDSIVDVRNGGMIINNGTWTSTASQTMSNSAGTATFNNLGIFEKTDFSDTTLAPAFNNGNGGQVIVLTGILALTGGGISAGSFDAEKTAVIFFEPSPSSSAYSLGSGSALKGAGNFVVSSGTVQVNSAVTVQNLSVSGTARLNGQLIVNADLTTGSFTLDYGVVSGTAPLTVTGKMAWFTGTLATANTTIASGAQMIVTGAGTKSFAACTLANFGTVKVANGVSFGGPATIDNYGSVAFAGGSGTTEFEATDFTNEAGSLPTGTVTVSTSAHVQFSNSTFTNLGTLILASGGALTVDNYTQVQVVGNLLGTLVIAGAAGSQYPLTVTGSAVLGGSLQVNFLGTGSPGEKVPVINGNTTGNFSVTPFNLPANLASIAVYSPPFIVTLQVRRRVQFTQGPSTEPVRTVISPPVAILVTDQAGNPMIGVPVTLSVSSGVLFGTTMSKTGADGVANFNELSLARAGTYTLTATASDGIGHTLTSGPSSPFAITPS